VGDAALVEVSEMDIEASEGAELIMDDVRKARTVAGSWIVFATAEWIIEEDTNW